MARGYFELNPIKGCLRARHVLDRTKDGATNRRPFSNNCPGPEQGRQKGLRRRAQTRWERASSPGSRDANMALAPRGVLATAGFPGLRILNLFRTSIPYERRR
jgi:hypothetical protein